VGTGSRSVEGFARGAFFGVYIISHIIQLTPQQQSAEPRNSASAEALAVARRPKEASREKTRRARRACLRVCVRDGG